MELTYAKHILKRRQKRKQTVSGIARVFKWGGGADIKKRAHVWCMNDVIREGMPEASFTISFNCLADLVSIIMLEYYYSFKGIGRGSGGLPPEKFLQKCFNLVHFSNLDSHTGPDHSKYN